MTETERLDLRLEVGVLTAGDLVAVDVGDGDLEPLVEALVAQTNVAPVIRKLLEALRVKAGVTLLTSERLVERIEAGLAGEVRHGADGGIDDVAARFGGKQQRCKLVAGGVVGVEIYRDADLLLERGYELLCGVGL